MPENTLWTLAMMLTMNMESGQMGVIKKSDTIDFDEFYGRVPVSVINIHNNVFDNIACTNTEDLEQEKVLKNTQNFLLQGEKE
jgi:hypothetical protein